MKIRANSNVILALVITLVLWSSAFAGIRVGLQAYGPGQVALLRFSIASIVLLIYALITRLKLPAVKDAPMLFVMGFLGFTVYHVALNMGEVTVSAGVASFLIATVPVFSTILALIFLRERLTVWGWTGMIISFSGIALISISAGMGLRFEPAALLVVVAAISESIFFVLEKPFLERYNGLQLTTFTLWTGTVFLLVYAPGLVQQIQVAPINSTLAIAYLGIFPAAIACVLWTYALSKGDVSQVTSTLNILPILSLAIAFFWLGEIPSAWAIVGGAITLAGVLLLNTRGKVPAAPRAAEKFSSHSVEAEEAIIGAILMNPDSINKIRAFLQTSDFFIAKHAWVWDAILTVSERGEAIDSVTVTEELRNRNQLESIGGPAFILYLMNNAPRHIHAETYARHVERAALRRRSLAAASESSNLHS